MPLFNVDLDGMERALGITAGDLPGSGHTPVVARLTALARCAMARQDMGVLQAVEHVRATLCAPAYISLGAVRLTLEACSVLNRLNLDACPKLPGAAAMPEPRQQGFLSTAGWYRRPEDRWWLSVTAQDMHEVAQMDAARDTTGGGESPRR
jgi:hypothetical protein